MFKMLNQPVFCHHSQNTVEDVKKKIAITKLIISFGHVEIEGIL